MARYCNNCNRKIGFFEDDFDGMCSDCYEKAVEQERIRLEEEQKRKIKEEEEEQRVQERQRQLRMEKLKHEEQEEEIKNKKKVEKFKKIFCNSIVSLQLYKNIAFREYDQELGFQFMKFEKSQAYYGVYDVMNYLIVSCISKLNENYSTDDIIEVFSDVQFFQQYIKEFVFFNSETLTELGFYSKEELLNSLKDDNIESIGCYCNKDTLEDYINTIIGFANGEHLEDINDFVYSDMLGASETCRNSKFLDFKIKEPIYKMYIFYFYALLVLYVTKLYEYACIFKSEKELYNMYKGLANETTDGQYIIHKIYPIYEKFYNNIFGEETLDIVEFHYIWLLTEIDRMNNLEMYKNDLNEMPKKLLKEIKTDYEIITESNKILKYFNIEEYIKVINKFKNRKTENFLIKLFIDEVKQEFSLSEILESLLKLYVIFNNLDVEIYNYNLNAEKERLLKGDFSKEKEMQKQELEYENVQNGYEFEEYVANLYQKLGYTIEKVTKKSGDQRSRCNSI